MGGYAEYAYGKSGSFMANYTYGLSLLIANAAIAISAVGYASVLFGITLSPLAVGLWTIFTLWLATVLNFGGARITGQISSVTIWGVILPVLFISVFGWFWFKGSLYVSAWNPNHLSFFDGISQSISITLWAFLGLESASANMDAVENPRKNVPIACLGGTIGAAVIYIISTNVMAGIVPNADLLHSNAPFGLAFAYMFTPFIGKIVMALMVISCFGSLLSWQFTIAQVFKSSAVEGYFPKIFNKVTKADAPVVGMVIITIIQTLLSLMTISPTLTKQFYVLVNLAVVTNLIPYLLSMGALNVMQKDEHVAIKKSRVSDGIAFLASIY
ncbi:MAG: putrescine-ornithine antiporter, partial [Sarcina sp.]